MARSDYAGNIGDGDSDNFPGGPGALEDVDKAGWETLNVTVDIQVVCQRCDWRLYLLEFQSD